MLLYPRMPPPPPTSPPLFWKTGSNDPTRTQIFFFCLVRSGGMGHGDGAWANKISS